jgi:hypothetical protein
MPLNLADASALLHQDRENHHVYSINILADVMIKSSVGASSKIVPVYNKLYPTASVFVMSAWMCVSLICFSFATRGVARLLRSTAAAVTVATRAGSKSNECISSRMKRK